MSGKGLEGREGELRKVTLPLISSIKHLRNLARENYEMMRFD
jgi:hypothetical protein